MTKWREKRLRKWKTTRKKGKLRFVLLHGCLFWSLSLTILTFITSNLFKHGLSFSHYLDGDGLEKLTGSFVGYLLFGVLYGFWMWEINENYYREHLQRDKE